MSMKLITPPAPIVTFADADVHLHLDGDTSQQSYVEMLIAAWTGHLDGMAGIVGQALGPQTWELSLDCFPCGAIRLPLGPVISVASVKYDDADGDEQTVSNVNYQVDTTTYPGWVVPLSSFSWPSTLDAVNAVRVRYQAGFATAPAWAKAAILLLVGNSFENREAVNVGNIVSAMPLAVDRLIEPNRRVGI